MQECSTGLDAKRTALVCVLLAVVVLCVFGWSLRHDFVNFDDDQYFYANPYVQSGLTCNGVLWASHSGYAGNWFPLTWLSLMLDAELFGTGPAGPHFTNVVLHAASTVLLFLLLRRLSGAPWRSAFVAGLFALHPLHVESVAWVSERKDVLSGLFFMLTLLLYARYAQARVKPSTSRDYWLALLFFALGLMSKPMLVTLPFVLLLLDWWPLGRIRWATPAAAGGLLREKIPFFALSAASCVITYCVQQGAMERRLSLGMRIANALVSYVRYMHKALWPTGLAVFYPLRAVLPATMVLGAGAVLIGITLAVIWGARRAPWFATGWFWYLGMLVPAIGLVQVGAQAMADRYTYLPLIGLFVMLCWSVPRHVFERRASKIAVCVAAGLVLTICAVLSRIQIGYWKDSETLFRHAVDEIQNNWLAHYGLGRAAQTAGRLREAIGYYEEAIRDEPDYAEAHNNLGVVLSQTGRIQEAIGHYEHALQVKPDYVEAHNNLGAALADMGRFQEATGHYEQALRLKPDSIQAHLNFGNLLLDVGRLNEAIQQFERALEIQPDCAEADDGLGSALAQQGRMSEAIEHWERALRSRPNYAEAHYDLGLALAGQGRLKEAMDQWEQALRYKPNFAQAHYNLAVASEQIGKKQDAIAHYEQALRIKPDYSEARTGLDLLRAVP